MAVLSDNIEQFIKSLLNEYDEMVELQRNELASYFSCAPSQINYVLATRFSPEKGYYIESKRGGGGYIKLVRIDADKQAYISAVLKKELAGGEITEKKAMELLKNLQSMGYIDKKTRRLCGAALTDKAIRIPANVRDKIRASMMKEMLLALQGEE